MVRIIHKIFSANDSEQHNDNINNSIKYLEFNKDRLLELAEKHYENLIEVLTNNAIAATTTSSNPTLSLPQSSSAFANLSNQSNSYRIEESERFCNNKGDLIFLI